MPPVSRSAATQFRAIPKRILPRTQLAIPRQAPTILRPAQAVLPSRCHSTSNPNPSFSSVNPEEVSHFAELASEWWDPHGSSRLLHQMNPLRHDFINACLDSQPEPRNETLSYLDIGCGGGIFAESAARLRSTRSVLAIDPTPSVLAVAKAHARKDPGLGRKLEYRNSSIEQLEVPQGEGEGYDIVSVFEVIEHIDQPGAFLDKVQPFVKPGGWLVMSTIARTWMSWLTTNLIAEDILKIVPKGTHDWNKYLNEEELRRFFMDKGWNSPRVMGVVYVPGLGWKQVRGSEKVGNYFFAVRRDFP
ncbi:unnamed protein product [Clonostachys byssicola]|uniref:Ubiquinone biosynthesis O-methyltransferase, mitochondrial n=1 Tax=Clonostachys byssicola TaxID=160290 RepID=A0A9N9USX3_9HYPO|nr:unnamed protein product [Clonostachys byssicola]